MRRMLSLTVSVTVALLALTYSAAADVPNQMNYQGQLTDDLGTPLDTVVSMTFTIYNDSSGGLVYWTETQMGVEVSGGLFNALLGSVTPIPDTVFADDWRWLGIQIGSDPEITPRTKLVTVPYAFRVATVDGATGGVISGDVSIQSDLTVSGKATIGPGHTNTGTHAFIAGASNTASGDSSTVSGGAANTASNRVSTVGGGFYNTASGIGSAVSGGTYNIASNSLSAVGGGTSNQASGSFSTIAGGFDNTASGEGTTVSGGTLNTASGGQSTIGGGWGNRSTYVYATIGGGRDNHVGGFAGTIGGGNEDTVRAYWGGVFCGYSNLAGDNNSDTAAFVGGGYDNSAMARWATVSGGQHNTSGGVSSTVSGGQRNTAGASSSTVSGGQANLASGFGSSVSGGYADTATGTYATVGGGSQNKADNGYATVGGGENNKADGVGTTIAGGSENSATNSYGTVCGGRRNSNSAQYSVIPGGYQDTLTSSAYCSMAFGYDVYVNSPYRVVFFDSLHPGLVGINRDDHNGGISHPIHVGTDGTNGNGAHLTSGGTWTNGSSRSFKKNFQPLDRDELLARISSLPVEAWQYKDSDERHIGPVSEDFVEAFDVGTVRNGRRDDKYLSPGDVAGVALAGVKELTQENQELRQVIDQLKRSNALLETRVTQLEKLKSSR